MRLRIALLGATALGLVISTGAYAAGGNKAYISQEGTTNSASVTQNSGATTGNQVGTSADNASQSGANNVLTIVQDGNGGLIGTLTGTNNYYTPGHLYPNPQFSITYAGVNQTSSGSGSNSAILSQHGDGAVIGDLQQTASATAAGNQAITDQTGDPGLSNYITHLWQEQDAGTATNYANITESGSNNVIDRVDQKARGTGTANSIIANIGGTGNGTDDLTGVGGFYVSRGFLAGATPSALIQNNYGGGAYGSTYTGPIEGNKIDLQVTGTYNKYGLTQKGYENTAGTVSISGNYNMFGSYQEGYSNTINAGAIAGDHNDVGIWQSGDNNTGTISVLSGGNNDNALSILQQGSLNTATITVTGSGNGSPAFTGPALTLASANPNTLLNGTILQGSSSLSSGNGASFTILGNDNAFAVAQLGSGNSATGKVGSAVGDSSNNSAAILQSGSNNVAVTTQTGAGGYNSVAISQ